MMDSKGRVWTTSKIRRNENAKLVQRSSSSKFAEWFPLTHSDRQASFYDPKTAKCTLIDTCYSTHHLQFDNDANETLYFNELSGPDRRLDRHEGLRRDEGRAESRGLVRAGARHQRRRQDYEALERRRGTRDRRPPPAFNAARRQPEAEAINLVRRSFRAPWTTRSGASASSYPGFIVRLDRAAIRRPRAKPRSTRCRIRARSPRHRHRSQRRRLDRACREQPSRQLRSPEVQGPDWSGESRRQPAARKAGRFIKRPAPG